MRKALVLGLVLSIWIGWMPVEARPQSGAPAVTKVDPPSWFVDHSMSTIQLLVRGSALAGATLVSESPAVIVERQQVNANGTYLIAYVRIDDEAAPGPVSLRVESSGGAADVPFELLAKLPSAGRFQGLTTDDVVYLLMPDRFSDGDQTNNDPPGSEGNYDRRNPFAYHGGDFKGVRDRLPYLDELGVTAIWLNPWYDNNDRGRDYHGYHATDFYATEEHFGTLEELRALVDAAHARGIKVIQDQVANHTGPEHPWVRDYPTPTWYNGTPENHLTNDFEIPAVVDPNASPADRRQVLEGWFAGILPDLNQEDPEVAQYLIQNTLWWIGVTGIDAIRQDTLPYVPRSFWARWSAAIEAEHPSFFVVGEVFNTAVPITSFFQGGQTGWDGIDTGVESVFDFPFFGAIRAAAGGQAGASTIASVIANDGAYPNPSVLVPMIGNHDVPRFATDIPDRRRLLLAQTVLLTTRGIPQLYYGDEIGMKGGADPDNRRDFPGGFPRDKRNAFTEEGRKKKEDAIFDHVQALLAIRRAHPALRRGITSFERVETRQLAYVRSADREAILVLVNFAAEKTTFELDVTQWYSENTLLLDEAGTSGSPEVTRVSGGVVRRTVKPLSAAVLVPDRASP